MKELKIINKLGESITFSHKAPFVLKDVTFDRNVNVYSSKGINQDGASYKGNTLAVGDMTIEFAILGTNKEELRRNRLKVGRVFNPKLGELEIINDGKKVVAIATEIPYLKEQNYLIVDGIVSFDVHDPYYSDVHASKVEIAVWQPAFEFPLEIISQGIELGYRETTLIANIQNKGDVQAGLKIVFKAGATVVNPSLFDVNTREYFKVTDTMEANDEITVTTGFQNKKVTLERQGVVTTFYNWDYNSTFLQLAVGDNLFRYDADSGIESLSVDIYYTQKYLGV